MDNNTAVQQENNELKARLRAFAAILRLNRDAFSFSELSETGVHIVNDTKTLLGFDRSSIVDLRNNRVLAEFSQLEVNQHTEYAKALRALCKKLTLADAPVVFSAQQPPEGKISGQSKQALDLLTAEGTQVIAVPLRAGKYKTSIKNPFVWILEYKEKIPSHVLPTLSLLAPDFGNALWIHTSKSTVVSTLRWFTKITFTRLFVILVLAFIIALFTVDVEHTVSAEFEIKPQSAVSSYSWFDCVIKKCHVQDGDTVKKGTKILTYDTDRMQFQLAAAKAACKEADAEYEQESKAAFTEREKLGKLKILSHKREQAQIAITEAKWYLAHSVVTAPADGMITLAEGSADKLSGRALRTGEKQFDIYTGQDMIAEIRVNEKDASVLDNSPHILLFLHTRPELPIHVKLLTAPVYPELTEQNIYCYNLKVKLMDEVPGLRYGMRGIARIAGDKVKLGYYLFRSAVLWYRGL